MIAIERILSDPIYLIIFYFVLSSINCVLTGLVLLGMFFPKKQIILNLQNQASGVGW